MANTVLPQSSLAVTGDEFRYLGHVHVLCIVSMITCQQQGP